MTRENADHDGAYRRLFSNEQLVEQLVEVFVGADIAALLDFSTMKRVNAVHHSETLVKRENDLLWEIDMVGGKPIYLVLMLEFQSSNDRAMAARIMTYLGLYYDAVVGAKGWSADDGLPPVLSVVLYNGKETWTAEKNVRALIPIGDSSPLGDFQPHLEYCLIEVGKYPREDLSEHKDLVSVLFLLEQAKTLYDVRAAIELTIERTFGNDLEGIRKDLLVWISKVLYTRMDIDIDQQQLESLTEVKDMLAENLDEWLESLRKEAREKGIEQGIEQGAEVGVRDGLKRALLVQLEERFGEKEGRAALLEDASREVLLMAFTLILKVESEDAFWEAWGAP